MILTRRQVYRAYHILVATQAINDMFNQESHAHSAPMTTLNIALFLIEGLFPDNNDELMALIHLCSMYDAGWSAEGLNHLLSTTYRLHHTASKTLSSIKQNIYSWWEGNHQDTDSSDEIQPTEMRPHNS